MNIFGKTLPVLADFAIMDSFYAHGDRREMADFLDNQKQTARKIWLVHGTIDRMESYKDYLHSRGFKNIEIPELGQEITIS